MGGGPVSPGELRHVLTPAVFSLLVRARLPYSKTERINFAEFGRDIFIQDPFSPQIKDKVWPVLKTLSKIGLDHMPDLTAYLPAPADPTYEEQCLGLQLLLDHCPRMLFQGVDQRWTYAYFSVLSQRLAAVWYALPEDQRPGRWRRPDDGRGTMGLDYWIGVRFWLGTPFVHSERLEHQEIALTFTEETRATVERVTGATVERVTGTTDPYREKRDQILRDLFGFPREYIKGPPQGHVTKEGWTFWMGMLMDIHKPIIDRFGRYPYLNATVGRDSTEAEKSWVERMGHFGEVDEDAKRLLEEDCRLGRWRPLGEGSLGAV